MHNGDLLELRNDVLQCLVAKMRREATELMVKAILTKDKIYSLRQDEKEEIWIYKHGIYVPDGKTYIKEFCRKVLGKGYTNQIQAEVISKIQTDTYIDPEEFFIIEDLKYVAVQNGVLDIFKNEIIPFTPKLRFFNKLPVVYEPTATCNNIINFFEGILKEKEDILVIQELFGFLLLRDYKYEKAFMLLGNGRNGKSKTVELIKRFLGVENCVNLQLQRLEEDEFCKSELFNKLANISPDISKDALKTTGEFKTLTGKDLVNAKRKFMTDIKFVNYAKLIFCSNELPRSFDTQLAFYTRWVLLEFPYTFVSPAEYNKLESDKRALYRIADRDIINKLSTTTELSGLLNWALIGLKRLLANDGFSYTKGTDDVKMMWIRKSDSLGSFIMDFIEEDANGMIAKEDFRLKYTAYCRVHKLKSAGDNEIKERLTRDLGCYDKRTHDGDYFWIYIKYKQNTAGCEACKPCYTFSPIGRILNSPNGINSIVRPTRLVQNIVLSKWNKDNLVHHPCKICGGRPCNETEQGYLCEICFNNTINLDIVN